MLARFKVPDGLLIVMGNIAEALALERHYCLEYANEVDLSKQSFTLKRLCTRLVNSCRIGTTLVFWAGEMDPGSGTNLMNCLSALDDPRQPSNGTLHDFQETLVIAICVMHLGC